MMRLFAIRDMKTGKVFEETFENKMHAKLRRNELNGESKRYTVTPGPDHDKTLYREEVKIKPKASKKKKKKK
jgi:hypothetical protein